jgi:hypothetical protein
MTVGDLAVGDGPSLCPGWHGGSGNAFVGNWIGAGFAISLQRGVQAGRAVVSS